MELKIDMKNYQSPYKNNIIKCASLLQPHQMRNEYLIYLKQNLIDKFVNKCYQNYGFISKIYKILEDEECKLEDENVSGSAKIKMKIVCKICLPTLNKEIICKIKILNKELYKGVNGPIIFIIEGGNIEHDNFYVDMNRDIRISKTSKKLMPDTYVRVLIETLKISDNEKNIIAEGKLLSIATDDEIKLFHSELNEDLINDGNVDEFIKNENFD